MASADGQLDVAGLTADLSEATIDDVMSRHRRERKELQAKIQALKKNAPKSDKKKRKEVMEEVARLEADIEKKHAEELKATEERQQSKDEPNLIESSIGRDEPIKEKLIAPVPSTHPQLQQQRVTKAQKRRDKKAREARQREEDIRTAEDDALYAPKAVEERKLQSKLRKRQLTLYHIPSDGDCLYNAIRHQLMQHGLGSHSVMELRLETANYIHANKDSLICYMTNPQTGDLLTDEEFEKYCDDVRNTPAWGGQIELKALSSILKVPIEVLQAEGSPTLQGIGEFAGPNLVITYHRHMYSLGEHYNSTIPMSEEDLKSDNGDGL